MPDAINARLLTLSALIRARWLMARLRTRKRLIRYQQAKRDAFLRNIAPRAPAFQSLRAVPAEQWPVMDKATLMSDFSQYNTIGLTTEDAWQAFESNVPPQAGYSVGASTGTSGNRGLYVVSSAERYRWLGVILSRALPDILTVRHRIAVVLPANSRLYDAANESGRLQLKFFDLAAGIEATFQPLADFNPTVIVAPPKLLAALTQSDSRITPQQVFSAAEVLSPEDRTTIENHFSITVREIYMATEGLFAVSCPHGTLHLIEDHIAFEWQSVAESSLLRIPLITDFSRRTQLMVRYRMNDLIELDNRNCQCGSPHQAIAAIHGREDDIFQLRTRDGSTATMTPDVIRNAIISADRSITDFRVIQTHPDKVELLLDPSAMAAIPAAEQALQQLFTGVGSTPVVTTQIQQLQTRGDKKLRRVMVMKQGQVSGKPDA